MCELCIAYSTKPKLCSVFPLLLPHYLWCNIFYWLKHTEYCVAICSALSPGLNPLTSSESTAFIWSWHFMWLFSMGFGRVKQGVFVLLTSSAQKNCGVTSLLKSRLLCAVFLFNLTFDVIYRFSFDFIFCFLRKLLNRWLFLPPFFPFVRWNKF